MGSFYEWKVAEDGNSDCFKGGGYGSSKVVKEREKGGCECETGRREGKRGDTPGALDKPLINRFLSSP